MVEKFAGVNSDNFPKFHGDGMNVVVCIEGKQTNGHTYIVINIDNNTRRHVTPVPYERFLFIIRNCLSIAQLYFHSSLIFLKKSLLILIYYCWYIYLNNLLKPIFKFIVLTKARSFDNLIQRNKNKWIIITGISPNINRNQQLLSCIVNRRPQLLSFDTH